MIILTGGKEVVYSILIRKSDLVKAIELLSTKETQVHLTDGSWHYVNETISEILELLK